MSNLASRVLVIVSLGPIAIGAMYLGGWVLVALGVGAAVVGVHEFYAMARDFHPVPLAGHAAVVAMVVLAHLRGVDGLVAGLALALLVAFVLVAGTIRRVSGTVRLATTVFAPLWIGVGIGLLVVLRDTGDESTGRNLLLAVVLGTWASDIGAYVFGRMFGRRKLAPSISPGKTVEGFIAGVVLGTLAAWWTLYAEQTIDRFDGIVVGIAVALAAPLGDLLESFIKRDVGVKDSGRLLAGHGGMLDRIDALLLSAPAAYAALALVS